MVMSVRVRLVVALSLTLVALAVVVAGRQGSTQHEGHGAATRRFDEKTDKWSAPFTATGDSVVLAFAFTRWRTPWVPESFLVKGGKATVDQGFASLVTLRQGTGREDPWKALGRGLRVDRYLHDSGAEFYRDRGGVRLIALAGPQFSCDTLILSKVSTHAARLYARDLARLRTDSGVCLGDSARRLRRLVGTASRRDRFGQYEILWYLGKPRLVVLPDTQFHEGESAAYVLQAGRVVEIWLHA